MVTLGRQGWLSDHICLCINTGHLRYLHSGAHPHYQGGMFSDKEKMMQKYIDQEPYLKVPDGVTPKPPKAQENKQKKQQPLIQKNNYSTDL